MNCNDENLVAISKIDKNVKANAKVDLEDVDYNPISVSVVYVLQTEEMSITYVVNMQNMDQIKIIRHYDLLVIEVISLNEVYD